MPAMPITIPMATIVPSKFPLLTISAPSQYPKGVASVHASQMSYGITILFVIMQKDFFQIRLSDHQIGYLTGGERPNQIVDVTTEQETDGIDRIFPATNTLQLIKIYLSMKANKIKTEII